MLRRLMSLAIVLGCVSPTSAGLFEEVADGLRFSGFVLDADYNRLTDSTRAVAAANFQGNTIDFGFFDVTANGPITLAVEEHFRGVPELSFTLSTGLTTVNPNGDLSVGPAQPLTYLLNIDSGTSDTTINGNFLFDTRAKINKFGSYDFRFAFSNRETTSVRGRFDEANGTTLDFDIGPIDIEGNIFADLLASVTEPFFQAAGAENVFAQFSGQVFRRQENDAFLAALQAKLDAGEAITEREAAELTARSAISSVLGDPFADDSFISTALASIDDASTGASGTAVPEPTAGLLLGTGLLLSTMRRRRVR